jgi:site-specific DNA-methyltransferase (adenine-specific)
MKFQKNVIHNECCTIGMKKLLDNCADVIIADPPYNINKDFGNDSDNQEMQKYLSWCEE